LADEAYGSGVAVGSSIWLRQRHAGETGLYVGFVADDEAEVNAAYAAAIKAGGTSEGEPAIRAYFGPSYYAANVADFDGNHLEIVSQELQPAKPSASRIDGLRRIAVLSAESTRVQVRSGYGTASDGLSPACQDRRTGSSRTAKTIGL
jgi:hypothetical protein